MARRWRVERYHSAVANNLDPGRIEVNGVVYRTLDDVPADLRSHIAALLEDADGDGVPDIVQGPQATSSVSTSHTETFIVDGVAYSSLDELPSQHRATMARLSGPAPSRPVATDSTTAPHSIVTKAGVSSRTKMLLAFAVIDAAVIGGVVWLLLR